VTADKIRAQALQLARAENERLESRKKSLELANISQVEYRQKRLELDKESEAIWELLGRLS
jgi:hypothetical protein